MPRAACDIIVVGASAGGINAISLLLAGLPPDLPSAVFVVIHSSAESPGLLPDIFRRVSPLPVEVPEDRQVIHRGRVYIAPPDRHLIIKPGHIRTPRGPKENGFRPAVDPLFRTAALAYGPRVVGVVLSGGLDDGTHGLTIVKEHGGVAIAQNPEEATAVEMPLSAIRNVEIDHIARVSEIPEILTRLAESVTDRGCAIMSSNLPTEHDVAEGGTDALESPMLPGAPSVYTCPECGGVLFELQGEKILRFRCHVGHGYTADSLLAGQNTETEAAVWTALRALEENADLRRRMADRMRKANLTGMAEQLEQNASEAEYSAHVLQQLIRKQTPRGSENQDRS